MSYLPNGLPAPVPENDGLDKPYWEATRARRADGPALQGLRHVRSGGRNGSATSACPSTSDWHEVSGRGRIYSWERPWHPVHPALKGHGPYIVVLVELPDAGNVRMLGNLLGDPRQDVRSAPRCRRCSSRTTTPSRPSRWCSGRRSNEMRAHPQLLARRSKTKDCAGRHL